MGETGQVVKAMTDYFEGDVKRINHFLKVYGFAKAIGEMEGLDAAIQRILEIAALTHDIGIKNSLIKYNSVDGSHQQVEGPPEAEAMLRALRFDEKLIERVCWLIAHHHTYRNIDGIDYQILVEADFLVNIDEENLTAALHNNIGKIFKTAAGKALLSRLYGAEGGGR
jgi:hypothetical protein